MKRVVNVNVLPGEPLDGSGKVCIHLFVADDAGIFVEPCVLRMGEDEEGRPQLQGAPARGRLACSPTRGVAPTTRAGATTVTPRTDDPRAVTCPKCISSVSFKEKVAALGAQ